MCLFKGTFIMRTQMNKALWKLKFCKSELGVVMAVEEGAVDKIFGGKKTTGSWA